MLPPPPPPSDDDQGNIVGPTYMDQIMPNHATHIVVELPCYPNILKVDLSKPPSISNMIHTSSPIFSIV